MTEQAEKNNALFVEDSWEFINHYFFERNWTDALPIIPPTEEKVYAMTEYVQNHLGWSREEVIGILEPKMGLATVEKIAVNAVMAGCKPEYMPVLISAVKGMAEERLNLFGITTATHNASVLSIVNGPIGERLDINCGNNVIGSRWHSTVAIGRAIKLIINNVGGILGVTNVDTQGHIAVNLDRQMSKINHFLNHVFNTKRYCCTSSIC